MTIALDCPTGVVTSELDGVDLSTLQMSDPPPTACLDDPNIRFGRFADSNIPALVDGTVCEQSAQRGVVLTTNDPGNGSSMPRFATVACSGGEKNDDAGEHKPGRTG